MRTVKPVVAYSVSKTFNIDGITGIYVDCADFDAFAKLPAAVEFIGKVLGKTGWNSDFGYACYQSNATLAFPVQAGR